jgi:hypothetical protein
VRKLLNDVRIGQQPRQDEPADADQVADARHRKDFAVNGLEADVKPGINVAFIILGDFDQFSAKIMAILLIKTSS